MIYRGHYLISRRNISCCHMCYLKRKVGSCVKPRLGPDIRCQLRNLFFLDSSIFFFFNLHFRQKIERSSVTGTGREVIVSRANAPFGLTVYGQYIYWTDWLTQKIYRANKYDGSGQTAMTTALPFLPNGIRAVVNNQELCHNPCGRFNGGCSHVCAPGKTLA